MRNINKLALPVAATLALALGGCATAEQKQQDAQTVAQMDAHDRFNHDFMGYSEGASHDGQDCLDYSIYQLDSTSRTPATAQISKLESGEIDVTPTTGATLRLHEIDNEHVLAVLDNDAATIAALKGLGCQPGASYSN